MTDIFDGKEIEIVVRDDSKVVWVNVNGVCALRICGIDKNKHRRKVLKVKIIDLREKEKENESRG